MKLDWAVGKKKTATVQQEKQKEEAGDATRAWTTVNGLQVAQSGVKARPRATQKAVAGCIYQARCPGERQNGWLGLPI